MPYVSYFHKGELVNYTLRRLSHNTIDDLLTGRACWNYSERRCAPKSGPNLAQI
jgi:hypothetical protein